MSMEERLKKLEGVVFELIGFMPFAEQLKAKIEGSCSHEMEVRHVCKNCGFSHDF